MNEIRNLRELRVERGLGQAIAAERMGMTQSGLSKLEREENPRLFTLSNYVRRVLLEGKLLPLRVEVLDPVTGSPVVYELELGVGSDDPGWTGPLETYGDVEAFYEVRPWLAEGYGWHPGDRSRGTAPLGSDEIFRVPLTPSTGSDSGKQQWTITICVPARNLGLAWAKRPEPVEGTVVATANTGEIWVLAADTDMRPVAQSLRRLQSPTLDQVGVAVLEAVA